MPLDISRRVYESVRNAVIYYAGLYYEQKGHLEFVHSVTGVRKAESRKLLEGADHLLRWWEIPQDHPLGRYSLAK